MDNGVVPPDMPPVDDDADIVKGPAWGSAHDALASSERDVIISLGAAVVARWSDLPRDCQKLLFNAAASHQPDAVSLRGHIARFLHGNAHPVANDANIDLDM